MSAALPLPARADAQLEMIPVDFLVKAGALLGESPAALGETLHLSIKDPVTARVFVGRIAELCDKGIVLGLSPSPLARTLLRAGTSRSLAPHLDALSQWMTTQVRHDDTRAREVLAAI